MRIWDIPCKQLCNKHLLGEHRELHCIWTFITTEKGGSYKKHPEVLRWKDRCGLLSERHIEQVIEMKNRGWKHNSHLDVSKINYGEKEKIYWQTLTEQIEILKSKKCKCNLQKYLSPELI